MDKCNRVPKNHIFYMINKNGITTRLKKSMIVMINQQKFFYTSRKYRLDLFELLHRRQLIKRLSKQNSRTKGLVTMRPRLRMSHVHNITAAKHFQGTSLFTRDVSPSGTSVFCAFSARMRDP